MYTKLFGLETVIFRYFNVYGDRQPVRGQYAPVVGIFLRQTANGEPMTVVGDGKQRRDFTHVSDVVTANISAASSSNEEIFGSIINVGNGENYSILELVSLIGGSHVHVPPRIGESRITLADNGRAQQWLGWRPTMTLKGWILEQIG
jgi:UDP-glucose 4-epimerase